MKQRAAWLAAFIVAISGCAAGVWYGNPAHPKSAVLHLGMSQQDARALFGPPQQATTQQFDRLLIDTWKYLDQTLVFHNGALASWEKSGN